MTNHFTKTRLFCPGPTPVGHEASLALLDTNVYHRTDDFRGRVNNCREGLKKFFGSEEAPLLLTASGTGAMEAAVVNLTSPGDQVIVIKAGKFGERWEKISAAYSCITTTVSSTPGQVPSIEDLVSTVKANPSAKSLFMQANETSTGVQLPVKEITAAVRAAGFSGLIVVGAISGMCAHQLEMDAWGIDCLLSGSQKGFGIPPGLAFIGLSEKAWTQISPRSRFYFDLQREKKQQDAGQTAFTPAIGLILALEAALSKLLDVGPEALIKHHEWLANACRAAGKALKLELFAPEHPSNALTAFKVPAGIDGKGIIKEMRVSDSAIFAGGQDDLAGKIIRMAHLGFMDRLDLISGIACLEFALLKNNHTFTLGAGVSAAMKLLS